MKLRFITFLTCLLPCFGFSQAIQMDLLTYKGLSFVSTQTEITTVLGQPNQTVPRADDCGFFSPEHEGQSFNTLDFGQVKFTGNQQRHFLIEWVEMNQIGLNDLKFDNTYLNKNTTVAQLTALFGNTITSTIDQSNSGLIYLPGLGRDDGLKLEVEQGKLVRLTYHSPC